MIEDVKRFIIFVDLGSVTRAAEKLHITQPALSLSIARLEKELKISLFKHKKKQLVITEQGEQFYRIATKIIELWEKAKQTSTYQINKPIISIGMYDNAALQLADYFQKHLETKHYKLDIKINASSNLLKDISYGALDIAVAVIDVNEELPKNAVLINTYTEELLPVANEKQINSYEQIPFIIYNQGSKTRGHIDNVFQINNFQPKIIAESSSTTFMKALAMSGCGICLVPKNIVKTELKNKELFHQRLPFTFTRKMGIFIKLNAGEQIENLAQEISKKLGK